MSGQCCAEPRGGVAIACENLAIRTDMPATAVVDSCRIQGIGVAPQSPS